MDDGNEVVALDLVVPVPVRTANGTGFTERAVDQQNERRGTVFGGNRSPIMQQKQAGKSGPLM